MSCVAPITVCSPPTSWKAIARFDALLVRLDEVVNAAGEVASAARETVDQLAVVEPAGQREVHGLGRGTPLPDAEPGAPGHRLARVTLDHAAATEWDESAAL